MLTDIYKFVGPEFYDAELSYRIPDCRDGDTLGQISSAADSAARFYKIEASALTPDQAHQMLSVRDYARAVVTVFGEEYHGVFADYLSRPLAAYILSEPDTLCEVVEAAEHHFEHGREPDRDDWVVDTTCWRRVGHMMAAIEAILAVYDWTPQKAAQSLRGRPRPKF